MVAGGSLEISQTTRLMPRTSVMLRLDTVAGKSCGSGDRSGHGNQMQLRKDRIP